ADPVAAPTIRPVSYGGSPRGSPGSSKGALVDLHLVPEDGDHVEADHRATDRTLGQPPYSQPPKPTLLGRGDRLDRRAEVGAPAGLHLADHQHASPATDEVELSDIAVPVALDDLVTLL